MNGGTGIITHNETVFVRHNINEGVGWPSEAERSEIKLACTIIRRFTQQTKRISGTDGFTKMVWKVPQNL